MHETSQKQFFNRRNFLIGGSASLAMVAAGCRVKQAEEAAPAAERRAVPLRIAMVGSDEDAEVVSRAWGSVTSQPLSIETIGISREDPSNLSTLPERAKNSDLLIYPLLAVADLFAADSIVPLSAEEFAAAEADLGAVYAAAKNGAAMYAGEIVALPVGAKLPALIATDSVDPMPSWADYDSWVGEIKGAAREPLAPGWAGIMFLWRVASTLETGWMFTPDDLSPLIDSQVYVDVLMQMKQTADRYQGDRLSPQQIWKRIQAGQIRGGICFQEGSESETQVTVENLPGEAEANRVLLDPFSPLISVSSSCRQTRMSKQFARWLSGGEGSDLVRRQVSQMTAVRKTAGDVAASGQQQAGTYGQWLRQRLTAPITLPALQLLSAAEYYRELDQQISRCLDEQASAEEALAGVATKWRELHESVGREKQERAWRRAQGMRA